MKRNPACTESPPVQNLRWQDRPHFHRRFGPRNLLPRLQRSGSVKHAEKGFKPFTNAADAANLSTKLGRKAGSNMVRFTIAWEGVHLAVDTIDYAYLDQVIAQLRAAFANRIYVLLDWHSDLFSRHLFNADLMAYGQRRPA
ncbi:MAG: cellulase family glycosylhydrolase [Turneriella sp.]